MSYRAIRNIWQKNNTHAVDLSILFASFDRKNSLSIVEGFSWSMNVEIKLLKIPLNWMRMMLELIMNHLFRWKN
jgi:hypothetical protein